MAARQAPPSLGFSRQEHWSGLPFPSPMHESEKWKWSRLVVSNSSWPHGLQPTRLLRPWDFPGKSTGEGCHCLLQHVHTTVHKINNKVLLFSTGNYIQYWELIIRKKSESESEVAQLCLTLCDPVDCSLPGSSLHGILQARILEWVAISFFMGSSQARDSRIAGRHFNLWARLINSPVVMYGCESWTIKKAEFWRINAFELWCWRRLSRVPWTARRSNQSILNEISPEYSLEGLMLKLKLQYLATWYEELTHLKRPWCW